MGLKAMAQSRRKGGVTHRIPASPRIGRGRRVLPSQFSARRLVALAAIGYRTCRSFPLFAIYFIISVGHALFIVKRRWACAPRQRRNEVVPGFGRKRARRGYRARRASFLITTVRSRRHSY